jgi:anaerobic selenocysteine-containing dehydrogenase
MKKLLFIYLSFCIILSKANAQLRDTSLNMSTHKVDANTLLQKSKKQKTAAWLLLGGGGALTTIGLIVGVSQATKDFSNGISNIFSNTNYSTSSSTGGIIMVIAGTGAMLGSIPLFIGAGNNKKKAHLLLKDETVFFDPQLNLKEHLVVATLKINF